MIQCLFELVDGKMCPRLPHGQNGPRVPDGVTIFTLEQAATRMREPSARLRADWVSTFGDVLDMSESAVLAGEQTFSDVRPEPAPTADLGPGEIEPLVPPIRVAKSPLAHRSKLLRNVVYPHFSDDEFDLFMEICRQRRLNPFCGQLIGKIEERRDKSRDLKIITTIGAFRLIAQRTGERAGEGAAMFCGPDENWKAVWPDDVAPFATKVPVFRKGHAQPYEVVVYWKERAVFEQRADGSVVLSEFWHMRPRGMLGKCGSAASHRAAFPEELGDIYTFDEVASFGRPKQSDLDTKAIDEFEHGIDPDSQLLSPEMENAAMVQV